MSEPSIETSIKKSINERARQKDVPHVAPLLWQLLTSPIKDHNDLLIIIKETLFGEKQKE